MVNVKNALLLAGCIILTTCSIGMDDTLGRTTDDPFAEIPNARSFNGDFSIILSWSQDEAADEYYLYRALDDYTPFYQLVYNGRHTTYRDTLTPAEENNRYLYKLSKRRGQKMFNNDLTIREKAGLGVVSPSRMDSHEPNNDIKHATVLSIIKFESNCYLYSSNSLDNIVIYDEDWYCVDIPPHWSAAIKLIEIYNVGINTVDHFYIDVYNGGISAFDSSGIKQINNDGNTQKRFYFRILPNITNFKLEHPSMNGGYGAFIPYTIEVSHFRPLD
jgi:hypothetical protein